MKYTTYTVSHLHALSPPRAIGPRAGTCKCDIAQVRGLITNSFWKCITVHVLNFRGIYHARVSYILHCQGLWCYEINKLLCYYNNYTQSVTNVIIIHILTVLVQSVCCVILLSIHTYHTQTGISDGVFPIHSYQQMDELERERERERERGESETERGGREGERGRERKGERGAGERETR